MSIIYLLFISNFMRTLVDKKVERRKQKKRRRRRNRVKIICSLTLFGEHNQILDLTEVVHYDCCNGCVRDTVFQFCFLVLSIEFTFRKPLFYLYTCIVLIVGVFIFHRVFPLTTLNILYIFITFKFKFIDTSK